MSSTRRVIPIKKAEPARYYDCSKCPAYCCSYDLLEVDRPDIARLARHFGISYDEAEQRLTKYDRDEKVRSLRHQKDEHFGSVCRFLDTKTRRCTVYEARPGICRGYPDSTRCGYYEFLEFEREHQGDPDFIAVA
ncbi:MAG: YkgJ family cysteine cluster protein [Betaproteobacteria bacterium]|nr:YkgJ family cysteine cluster protein [Betaproteobacteria bacterium]